MTRPSSVITVHVCQVARCGDQSAYLCYNCRFKFRKQGVVIRMHRPFFVIFIANFNTETGNTDTESLFFSVKIIDTENCIFDNES